MNNFSATLLIPTSIRESRRVAGQHAMNHRAGRRAAETGRVIDTIVASILGRHLG